MMKASMAKLTTLQTLCLLIIPLTALGLGATLIFLAVRCNLSGGLQINSDGDIVCMRADANQQSAIDVAAIVVKVVVISVIILVVAVSMTICMWFVMRRKQEEMAELAVMKEQAADVEKLMAAEQVCVVDNPNYKDNSKEKSYQEKAPFTV